VVSWKKTFARSFKRLEKSLRENDETLYWLMK
jgi:hypothetical protein